MTLPEPAGNDGGGTPPPETPEVLFTLWANRGVQVVGKPMSPGTGRLKIEITPTQMIRLQQELSNRAIIALMLVLEYGTKGSGQRVEIEGWSARWLIEKGMARTTAEKAARELADKGYIRSERMPGATSPLGKKLGVVPPSAINFEAEDEPGVPRTDGRPRLHKVEPTSAASAESGNGADPVDNQGKTTVSADSRNGGSPERRKGENTDVFPQVRPVSAQGRNGESTGPSSSGSSEEGLFFLPGQGQSLTRPDLTRFFAQPALIEALAGKWEVIVALLARHFAPQATRCAELVDWLGDPQDAHPETRLAQIVVDLLKVPPVERFHAAAAQESYLRSRGVKFRQTNPDDFLAAFVVAIVTALDSSRPIESWGGWFGAGLKRESQFQGKVLSEALDVFSRLLRDPDNLIPPEMPPPASPQPGSAETTFAQDDPSYVDRLRLAAEGTPWEDDISFDLLLRNPGQQARLLIAYERRRSTGNG